MTGVRERNIVRRCICAMFDARVMDAADEVLEARSRHPGY